MELSFTLIDLAVRRFVILPHFLINYEYMSYGAGPSPASLRSVISLLSSTRYLLSIKTPFERSITRFQSLDCDNLLISWRNVNSAIVHENTFSFLEHQSFRGLV